MLESCSDLAACEVALQSRLSGITLLGELGLSQEDYEHLGELIQAQVARGFAKGMRVVWRQAPTAMACYLVGAGTYGYREGDYWSSVWAPLGLHHNPSRAQRLGRRFLRFLNDNQLPTFQIPSSHRYVTPVLIHGGIPTSCLPEYFDRVLLPSLRHITPSAGFLEEIVEELGLLRADELERQEIETRLAGLRKQSRRQRQRIGELQELKKAHDEILTLWEIEAQAEGLNDLGRLPSIYSDCRTARSKLEHKIQELKTEQERCQSLMAVYTESDQAALELEPEFRAWANGYTRTRQLTKSLASLETKSQELAAALTTQAEELFHEGWQDNLGEEIAALDLDQFDHDTETWKQLNIEVDQLQAQLEAEGLGPAQASPLHIPTLALGAAGGLLSALGLLTSLPPMLAAVGAVAVAASGYTHMRRARTISQRRQALAHLEELLHKAQESRHAVSAQVSQRLDRLALHPDLTNVPPPDLVATLRTFAQAQEQLVEVGHLHARLQAKIKDHGEGLAALAARLSIREVSDVEMVARSIAESIQQAKCHRAEAQLAAERLNQSIEPQLERFRQDLVSVQEKTEEVERQLRNVGSGDIEAGLDRITQLTRVKEDAVARRRALQARLPNLERIEEVLRTGQDDMDHKIQQAEESLKNLNTAQSELNSKYDQIAEAYPGVDEPIRKYLLYGAEPAKRFLMESASLLQRVRAGSDVTEVAEAADLPTYVVSALTQWWEKQQSRKRMTARLGIEEHTDGQRFSRPVLLFDPVFAEVTLQVSSQVCSCASGVTHVELAVEGKNPEQQQNIRLTGFREGADLLRTEATIHPLLHPSHPYAVSLLQRREVLQRWNIPAMRPEAACYAFDGHSGRLLADGELPQAMVWIVSRGVRPADESLIREEGQLFGQWYGHSYWAVDLTDVDELQLMDQQGNVIAIPTSVETTAQLGLAGGRQVAGVTSDGAPVYSGPPPRIRIPVSQKAELGRWRFALHTQKAEPSSLVTYHRVSDLANALEDHVAEGWVDVNLSHSALLGEKPFGAYRVHAHKGPFTDWDTALCLVPALSLDFDKPLYVPCEVGQTSVVEVKATIDADASLHGFPPTRTARVDPGQVRLEGTTECEALHCLLSYPETSQASRGVPLAARVPKVRWRLQGLEASESGDWRDKIEELWLGDWEKATDLSLVIDLGTSMDSSVQLQLLERSSARQQRTLREGKARFDLLPFRDELRAMLGLQTLTITFPDLDIRDTPLFRIRTRWEARNIQCVQRTEQDRVVLEVTWNEVGKTDGKTKYLRLWRLAASAGSPVVRDQVSKTSHRIQLPSTRLPAGQYQLELALDDAWSSTSPQCPAVGALNTQLITIAAGADPLQDRTLRVRFVGEPFNHKRYPLKGTYTFRIIGKIVHHELPSAISDTGVLVTETNEGWYVAEVDVVGDPELQHEVWAANPVKIEYDTSRHQITSAEDRAGDGAMYCCECQRLHWSQATIKFEEARHHMLLGPVERFYIS